MNRVGIYIQILMGTFYGMFVYRVISSLFDLLGHKRVRLYFDLAMLLTKPGSNWTCYGFWRRAGTGALCVIGCYRRALRNWHLVFFLLCWHPILGSRERVFLASYLFPLRRVINISQMVYPYAAFS